MVCATLAARRREGRAAKAVSRCFISDTDNVLESRLEHSRKHPRTTALLPAQHRAYICQGTRSVWIVAVRHHSCPVLPPGRLGADTGSSRYRTVTAKSTGRPWRQHPRWRPSGTPARPRESCPAAAAPAPCLGDWGRRSSSSSPQNRPSCRCTASRKEVAIAPSALWARPRTNTGLYIPAPHKKRPSPATLDYAHSACVAHSKGTTELPASSLITYLVVQVLAPAY